MTDRQLAHGLLRLALGIDILLHGLVRLPHLTAFADGLTQGFAKTALPLGLVHLVALVIPIAEAVIGLFLTLGLYGRQALVSGMALMILLVTGTALKQAWPTLGTQLVYLLVYYLLLARFADDGLSVDAFRRHTGT